MGYQAAPQIPQMGRFARSKSLLKSSWSVVKQDRELLALPAMAFAFSVLAIIVIGAIALGVALAFGLLSESSTSSSSSSSNAGWIVEIPVLLFLYTVMYTIANYFGVALSAGALMRFRGTDPTVASSLKFARARLKSIVAFSILQAIVGTILNMLEERLGLLGRIAVWLVGTAWNVATFFVLPVIADSEQQIGAVEAVKASSSVLKRTWGESLILNAGIGLISTLIMFAYLVPAGLLIAAIGSAGPVAAVVSAVPLIIGFALVALVLSGLSAIAKAAVYFWATTGSTPAEFELAAVSSSVAPKG